MAAKKTAAKKEAVIEIKEDEIEALKETLHSQQQLLLQPKAGGSEAELTAGGESEVDLEMAGEAELAANTKFPYSVMFIIGNEFCERFSYYGMKAILPIFLTSYLLYSEDRATTIIHSFNFMAYFCSLFGGILSDSWLGKYRTILSLSVVYCIGSGFLAVTSFHGVTGDPPRPWGLVVGLLLVGVGTGGIKPCVSSFGGDQFDPSQAKALALYFSAFYFSINAGSVLSMFITPILRKDVHCFGQDSCYPLAFGLPAILMLVATVIFVVGSFAYKKRPAEGNVVLRVVKAVGLATGRRLAVLLGRAAATEAGSADWLAYAEPENSPAFIVEVRRLLSVLTVFAPICAFWALYDQQGSRWTYQAIMMNGALGRVAIKPEQMGIANAILILALIPVFDRLLYPAMAKMRMPLRALPRMWVGMALAVSSFIMAAVLQFVINSRSTFAPDPSDPALMVCVDGCVSMLWQLPQYLVLTCGEVMLSITGLEFAYSQAPASMKSVCQACWLLTVAFGNLLVMVLNEVDPVGRILRARGARGGWGSEDHIMAWNFIFWAAVLGISTVWFGILSKRYKYVEDAPASARSSQRSSGGTLKKAPSNDSVASAEKSD